MIEGSWWAGRSVNFYDVTDPQVLPSEAILKFETFDSVIQQLRVWQTERIVNRRLTLASMLRGSTTASGANENVRTAEQIPRQKPDWFLQLPDGPRELLAEVYVALELKLRALPAMGIRAVIDIVFVDMVGDVGPFEQKLKLVRDTGQISEFEQSILSAAIEAGSASAHRGHIPTGDDLTTLVDIAERLLHGRYILPAAAERMRLNTPKRGER